MVARVLLLVLVMTPLMATELTCRSSRSVTSWCSSTSRATTPEQIRQVTDAFRDLRKKIPGITAFEDGVNNSPEGKNLGFTHVYMLTFEDAAARDAYLPHPEHAKFGQLLGQLGVVADAFVVDYAPARRQKRSHRRRRERASRERGRSLERLEPVYSTETLRRAVTHYERANAR